MHRAVPTYSMKVMPPFVESQLNDALFILHLGNILNNGYLNSKFLRRHGICVDVLNLDYRHVQGQPEWEEIPWREGELAASHAASAQRAGFIRPQWFHDISFQEIPSLVQKLTRPTVLEEGAAKTDIELTQYTNPTSIQWDSPFFQRFPGSVLMQCYNALRTSEHPISKHALQFLLPLKQRTTYAFNKYIRARSSTAFNEAEKRRAALVDAFATHYPGFKPLTPKDVMAWEQRAYGLAPLLHLYSLIQAYGIDPIYPLIACPDQPFICFEHGTLRDFPYEDSSRGRLYALSVKKAEHVFITNADVRRSAEHLGLENYSFVPHPVDDRLYRPQESPLRSQLEKEHGCNFILLGPARHHWKNCPKGMETSWLKRNDILFHGVAEFIRRRPDAKALLILFEWGQEVELSKQRIDELGLTPFVHWEPLSSKPVMVAFYNAADVVLDQFNDGIGTFGTVVPESMACAKPVILNYKKELHHWCYSELPPALNARTAGEVAEHLAHLWDAPEARKELGESGRAWFKTWHSPEVVVEKIVEVYRGVAARRGLPSPGNPPAKKWF